LDVALDHLAGLKARLVQALRRRPSLGSRHAALSVRAAIKATNQCYVAGACWNPVCRKLLLMEVEPCFILLAVQISTAVRAVIAMFYTISFVLFL